MPLSIWFGSQVLSQAKSLKNFLFGSKETRTISRPVQEKVSHTQNARDLSMISNWFSRNPKRVPHFVWGSTKSTVKTVKASAFSLENKETKPELLWLMCVILFVKYRDLFHLSFLFDSALNRFYPKDQQPVLGSRKGILSPPSLGLMCCFTRLHPLHSSSRPLRASSVLELCVQRVWMHCENSKIKHLMMKRKTNR